MGYYLACEFVSKGNFTGPSPVKELQEYSLAIKGLAQTLRASSDGG